MFFAGAIGGDDDGAVDDPAAGSASLDSSRGAAYSAGSVCQP